VKAITLTQPWATLVAIGAKRFETRSWQPSHLGRIAIHAASDMPAWAHDVVATNQAMRRLLDERQLTLEELPRGAVVAIARLRWAEPTSCVYLPDMLERLGARQERELGNFGEGRWAWFLDDVRPLREPIPARGALGLWEWRLPEPAGAAGGGRA
jgi:hypothetical protein